MPGDSLPDLGERVENGEDPGEDLPPIDLGGEAVEAVEEEGEDDVEKIPEDEAGDEEVVAGLHLQPLPVQQQDEEGDQVS